MAESILLVKRSRLMSRLACAALLTAAAAPSARAEYYGFTTTGSPDILYQEVRYPYWPHNTYNALYNTYLLGDSSAAAFFYSGLVVKDGTAGDTANRTTNEYIWSFWPVANPILPGDSVKPVWWNPPFYDVPSIGEGASGKVQATGLMGSMQCNVWYSTAMRVWTPPGATANEAFVGQWLRNGATGAWSHIATMRAPFRANRFEGIGGFIEALANSTMPRRVEFRNVYYRSGSAWLPSLQFKPSTRGATEVGDSGTMENGTVAYFENANNTVITNYVGNMGPGDEELTWTLSTPATPSFDSLVVQNATAQAASGQVLVKWEVPAASAPQFAYKVEIFPTADTSGTPTVTKELIQPDQQECIVDAPGIANPVVRLTIRDIFDRWSTPQVIAATPATPRAAENPAGTTYGLYYHYYYIPDGIETLPTSFPPATGAALMGQGVVLSPDVTVRTIKDSYTCRFTGYIDVPTAGLWSFHMKSCDGSKLLIGENVIVDNDVENAGGAPKTGTVALAAGRHAFELQYFMNYFPIFDQGVKKNENILNLEWEGPGTARSPIPESAWSHPAGINEPTVTLTAPAAETTLAADQIHPVATFTPNGNQVSSVRLISGATTYGSTDGDTSPLNMDGLLPNGNNRLRARLVYTRDDVNYTYDSPSVNMTVVQPNIAPWTHSAIGSGAFPQSASMAANNCEMTGDQLNFIWQEITGNESIIVQVPNAYETGINYASQFNGEGFASTWSGGIMFRENLTPNPGSELGLRHLVFFKEVSGGTYLQSSDNANAGGFIKGSDLGLSYTWLKVTRSGADGNLFTAYASTDGITWTAVGTRTMATPFPQKMYVGVFTLARPSSNTNPNHWIFKNISFGSTGTGFQITGQPQGATVTEGALCTLSVAALSARPLAFQWQKDGVDIPGANAAEITFGGALPSDSGNYQVRVSDGATTLTSNAATLTVTPYTLGGVGYERAVKTLGPLAYWRLGETSGTTATDIVGGHNGTYQNLTLAQPGPRPPAVPALESGNVSVKSSANANRVSIPALNLNTGTLTITGWFKRNGAQTSYSGLVLSRSGNTIAGLHLGDASDLRYMWNGQNWNWSSGLTLPDNEWSFAALVVGPSKATIYQYTPGGTLLSATNTATHGTEEFDGLLYIGQDSNSSSRTFIGGMDEVALFNRELSEAEIQTLITPRPGIAISASGATAAESGAQAGEITLSLAYAAAQTGDITISLAAGGTAAAGADYTALPATVTLPAGQTQVSLPVTPLADSLAEGPETVIAALAAGRQYYVIPPASATVTIADPPYDTWLFQHFGANAGSLPAAGNTADPDHDGLPNLVEYVLGSDPNATEPSLAPAFARSGAALQYTFRRNLAATDATCILQQSSNLVDWSPCPWPQAVLSDDGLTRVIQAAGSTTGGEKQFLRLKVTRP